MTKWLNLESGLEKQKCVGGWEGSRRVAGEIYELYSLQLWNSHLRGEVEMALFAKAGWTVGLEFW